MKKILIVDDDAPIREMMRGMLDGGPYEVAEAVDGNAAIRAALDHPPDLVILDWMLPILSGYQVWEELRKDIRTVKVPILVVTAFSGALQTFPPHQVLHAILKPFPMDLFLEQVRILSGV